MPDFGRTLNALIQALPPEGGVVTAGPGQTAETVIVDRPCTIRLGYGTYEYIGNSCLFDVLTSCRIVGEGHGGLGTNLDYAGPYAVDVIRTTEVGYFGAKRLCIRLSGEDTHSIGIHQVDPVGFRLEDIFVSHGPGANSVVGIQVSVTRPNLVPQRGFGVIDGFLYTGEPPNVLPGSCGIALLGIPGGGVVNIAIRGYGNIEQAECGLYATCTAQVAWNDPCFFQGCGTGIKLGPYSSSGWYQTPRFNQCGLAIDVADTCEDNHFINPGWDEYGMKKVQDAGVRTIMLAGSRGPWNLASVPLVTQGDIKAGSFSSEDNQLQRSS